MSILRRHLAIVVVAVIFASPGFLVPRAAVHAAASRELHVAAASDLRFALEELSRLFERQRAVPVRLTFGSSGQLAAQIEQGAPFSIFFSANEGFVRSLAEKGHIDRTSIQLYAIGRIALWVRNESPLDLSRGLSVLLDERIRFVAIANPEHAPYGQAAVQAMRASGLMARVQPRLVLGENISQTLQFVQTGNADIGIVALSLAIAPTVQSRGRYHLVPAYLHRPIRQTVGVTTRAVRPDQIGRAHV